MNADTALQETLSNRKVSVDASVLVELLNGTIVSEPLRVLIEQETFNAYITNIALTEAQYVLCREIGREKARSKIDKLIQAHTLEIVEPQSLVQEAAELKCERSLPLGDCFTLALAGTLNGKALFARPEEDLTREARKKPFAGIEIVYLESKK